MVVGQCQIHHRAGHDLTVHDHRAFLNFVHAEDTGLRGVQDRRGHERAVDATVRDGEGAALHFCHGQFAVTGAFALFSDLFFDVGKAFLVDVTQNRNNQTLRCTCRDAHVDKVLVHDVCAVDFGVHFGHFFQRVDAGLGEERHKAQTCAVLLLELVFVLVAQRHHLGHVDLVVGGQHRGCVLSVFQAARDGLAQTGHLDAFFAGSIVRSNRCARRFGCLGCGRGRGGRRNSACHVFFHGATVTARTLNLIAADACFGHGFLGGGRIFDVRTARACGWCAVLCVACGRCGLFGGRCGGTACAFCDHGKLTACFDSCAFACQNFGQGASGGRGDLNRDLVCFQFTQDFVLSDRFAFFLEPCRNGCFGHGFTQRRDHHVNRRARCRRGVCFGFGLFGRCRCCSAVTFRDVGQQRVNAHCFTFGCDDFRQCASGGRRDFYSDLIGFQFAQHFVHSDSIAGLFEPCRNGCLGYGFTQCGYTHFGGHVLILQSSALHRRALLVGLCERRPDLLRARPMWHGPRNGGAGVSL